MTKTTPTPGEPLNGESVRLLPCPFCGGEAKVTARGAAAGVSCTEKHFVSTYGGTIAEAIAAWNTRPTAQADKTAPEGERLADLIAAAERAYTVLQSVAADRRKIGPIATHAQSAAWQVSLALKGLVTPQSAPSRMASDAPAEGVGELDLLEEIETAISVMRKGAVRRKSKRGVIVDIDATEAVMVRAADLMGGVTKALASQVAEREAALTQAAPAAEPWAYAVRQHADAPWDIWDMAAQTAPPYHGSWSEIRPLYLAAPADPVAGVGVAVAWRYRDTLPGRSARVVWRLVGNLDEVANLKDAGIAVEPLYAALSPSPGVTDKLVEALEPTDDEILKSASDVRESSVAWADDPEEFAHLIELTPAEIRKLFQALAAARQT